MSKNIILQLKTNTVCFTNLACAYICQMSQFTLNTIPSLLSYLFVLIFSRFQYVKVFPRESVEGLDPLTNFGCLLCPFWWNTPLCMSWWLLQLGLQRYRSCVPISSAKFPIWSRALKWNFLFGQQWRFLSGVELPVWLTGELPVCPLPWATAPDWPYN